MAPHGRNSVDYGITRQIHSYNIITLNFHEFENMWCDMRRPGPVSQRLKHLWAPPEWTRAESQDRQSESQNRIMTGDTQ